MTQWYVKDLSKLTGISVQTLHHYDRIALLKPSVRLPNGYRVYSEKDLLQLQQIIALKFFGFELAQINALLTGNAGALEHFAVQAKLLERKANTLLEASHALKSIIADVANDKSIPWEAIIKLIEVYRMTQELEHPWVKDIFTPDELKQYVAFEAELKANSTPDQEAAFKKNWSSLAAEISDNLANDPKSAMGIALGEKFMQWVNGVYGKKYAHLRTKKFEKGFCEGKGLDEVGLTPAMVSWIDQAMDAYWRDSICGILDQVGKAPSAAIATRWHELLDDMYGEDDKARNKFIQDVITLNDARISKQAKEWLQSLD